MTDLETWNLLSSLGDRLRDVLTLLANAPVESTTIYDDQGTIEGHDQFIATSLRDEAAKMLAQWNAEEAKATKPKSANWPNV